jgi:hypothetical protein
MGAFGLLVAKMPNYLFLFQNGIPEDHLVELLDDSTAVEEGLKTASGLIVIYLYLGLARNFTRLKFVKIH